MKDYTLNRETKVSVSDIEKKVHSLVLASKSTVTGIVVLCQCNVGTHLWFVVYRADGNSDSHKFQELASAVNYYNCLS